MGQALSGTSYKSAPGPDGIGYSFIKSTMGTARKSLQLPTPSISRLPLRLYTRSEPKPLSFEMPVDRFLERNVHFYDASVPGVSLGGLIQNGSVTAANFLDIVGILLITGATIQVRGRGSGHIVTRTNNS